MSNLQIGVCNGLPVIIDVPAGGLLPINYKQVELRYEFQKDAPESYRPLRFVNSRLGQYGKMWGQGYQSGMAGYPGTDNADWIYPYFEAEADALVAMGGAVYYVGPSVDMDHRGRPATPMNLAAFGFTSKSAGRATFSVTTSSNPRNGSITLYRLPAGASYNPINAVLCASMNSAPSTTYSITAGTGTPIPAGSWDFYAAPAAKLSGYLGQKSGPVTVAVT